MPRRLGQHFLRGAFVDRLLDVVDPQPDEVFFEIGPGAGALTAPLAESASRVVAIEIDAGLARRVAATAPPNVEIVQGDALKMDLRSLVPEDSRVVGNLPYYVSSPLLRRILDLRDRVRDAHVMLQDEVARRIASPPGSRSYGILSVLYALWADVDVPLRFPPEAFRPPPRVSSALLRARFRDEPRADVPDLESFERFLRQAFARRRRTLENNLQDSYPKLKDYLRFLNLEGSRRAETLGVVEFAALWRALKAG
ncbi:MAG: 16S rRNA (adenine(1518)-N(6)/adenine(1519)-N(6))-dimethyltransferase RsmA [Acidobacteria bacterium]|jgi:16S rRNA (adenine1518-N6/adenine1519-N6)-dimethyltransferase|nr:16S rRNA (adenine(1518)-N(6)/adenine(1519)-N(6))-dimethyltransferase RsmA [Acidobacteriota bacterium]